jgi:SulP family sulfate permease
MINVRASGARTRISTFLAGAFLLILVVTLGEVVAVIPMAALVAIMIFVSWATFDWHSVRPSTLSRMPVPETLVMLSTVAVTVWTHNLALGVIVGVLVAMVAFARRVAHFVTVDRVLERGDGRETAVYTVHGELFFASSNDLYTMFDYAGDPQRVVIDFSDSHLWDASTVAALDSVTDKYAHYGKNVEIVGLNQASRRMRVRLGGMLNTGH